MAQIVINEISQNYTYNIGASSFATVAMPITSSWGPGYIEGSTDVDQSNIKWTRFPATREGLESFVTTYRGPVTNYRLTKDYSYQMAMTLLTSGYDVLTCRLSNGQTASNATDTNSALHFGKVEKLEDSNKYKTTQEASLTISAKYPGEFGNRLKIKLKAINKNVSSETHKPQYVVWNLLVSIVDPDTKQETSVENLIFVFDEKYSTDSIPIIDEIESDFIELTVEGALAADYVLLSELGESIDSDPTLSTTSIMLSGGSDTPDFAEMKIDSDESSKGKSSTILTLAKGFAEKRYGLDSNCSYISAISELINAADNVDMSKAQSIYIREWNYTSAYKVYDELTDRLSYNPNRIISPGWDDQDFRFLSGTDVLGDDISFVISPLHSKLMDVAFLSRCATAYIDIPRSMPISKVYNESDSLNEGYAQMLARFAPESVSERDSIYATHSALFAPWGQYKYVGCSKQSIAPPSFLALLIQRAMILNQSTQYEWILPTNRKHNLKLGKLDYVVTNHVLDQWQSIEGVGVNVVTNIPDLGTSLWGNSTLYEVPPATYQALANLSTRLLVNAIEDVAYRAGISITFNYNNGQAYDRFYAAVTPTLDTMKNAGAIEGYYVRMAADINSLDSVNANTCVGQIYLQVNGVINNIIVDLVALPPSADLDQFKS